METRKGNLQELHADQIGPNNEPGSDATPTDFNLAQKYRQLDLLACRQREGVVANVLHIKRKQDLLRNCHRAREPCVYDEVLRTPPTKTELPAWIDPTYKHRGLAFDKAPNCHALRRWGPIWCRWAVLEPTLMK